MKNQILTLLLILLIPIIAVSQDEESRYNYFKIIEMEVIDSQSDTFRYHEDEQDLGFLKHDKKNNLINVSDNKFIVKQDVSEYLGESETSGNVLAFIVENMQTGAEQFLKVYRYEDTTILFYFFSIDDDQVFAVRVRQI